MTINNTDTIPQYTAKEYKELQSIVAMRDSLTKHWEAEKIREKLPNNLVI